LIKKELGQIKEALFVLGTKHVVTTSDTIHEISNLEDVLSDILLEKEMELLTDKGYYSKKT